ncbi:MAG: aldo/keto reductase, partial [Magnetococcales bacterium]|nr:aldo/keto reductase [Magnetococcales bacterium]
MDRRNFIKGSLAMAAGLGVSGQLPQVARAAEGEKATVQGYRLLGKTGIKMSDVSFGAGKLPSAAMVHRAIDRGINYFDTAPDYGPSEDFLGEAMKGYPNRDKVHIASKFCQPIPFQAGKSHLQVGSSKEDYIAAVDNSLKRMNLDYLDVVFVHAIGELTDYDKEKARLLDENMLSAFQSLKQAGKAKYLAISSHGPHNMEKLMADAVECGHYDLMMVAFNFMKFPKLPEVMKAAHQKGMGVIAMKTQAGAKESGLVADGAVFEQAALKWVLKHPEVSG